MKNPAFQFYPADFIMGTSMMTAEETGGYIRLLCHQWSNGFIVNRDKVIIQLTGVYDAESLEVIKGKFILDEFGNLINQRLENVRLGYLEHQKRQSENGKKGGRPKNPNETQTKPKHKAKSNPNHNPNHNPNESSSSSSSSSITISNTTSLEKKISKKKSEVFKHSFSESKYFDNFELFNEDFSKTKTAIENPSIDKKKLYNTLENSQPNYKYIDWIKVAVNWYSNNPAKYKFSVASILENDPAYNIMTKGQQIIHENRIKREMQSQLIKSNQDDDLNF